MTVKIDGTNTTANPGITGSDTDTGLQFGTNEVKIVTDGNDRVTVDSSGRLLVGTSSSYGSANSDDLTIGDRTQSEVGITLGSTVASAIRFADAGNVSAGMIQYVHNSGGTDYMNFYTNTSERMRILSSGGLTFNGDTAQANALDDYEEGTWTPDLRFGGGTTGLTYSNRVGKYVKIGRLVWVTCRVVLTNKGSATGSAQVFGLPYGTSTESNTHLTPGVIWFTSASVQGSPQQTIIRTDGNNQGYIEIRNLRTGNEDVFDHSDVNNDFQFAFSLTYLAQ